MRDVDTSALTLQDFGKAVSSCSSFSDLQRVGSGSAVLIVIIIKHTRDTWLLIFFEIC